jgi:hypothetical protein
MSWKQAPEQTAECSLESLDNRAGFPGPDRARTLLAGRYCSHASAALQLTILACKLAFRALRDNLATVHEGGVPMLESAARRRTTAPLLLLFAAIALAGIGPSYRQILVTA